MTIISATIAQANTQNTNFPSVFEDNTSGVYVSAFQWRNRIAVKVETLENVVNALGTLTAKGIARVFFGVSALLSDPSNLQGVKLAFLWNNVNYALVYSSPIIKANNELSEAEYDEYHAAKIDKTGIVYIASTEGLSESRGVELLNKTIFLDIQPENAFAYPIVKESMAFFFMVWLNSSKSHSDFQTEWDIVANSQFIITED